MPWTWEIKNELTGEWELCHWALFAKKNLLEEGKPSPEARPVCVRFERGLRKKRKKVTRRLRAAQRAGEGKSDE